MKCPHCHAENDDSANFCSSCGYNFMTKEFVSKQKHDNKKFYIVLGVLFVAFVLWLYAPSKAKNVNYTPLDKSTSTSTSTHSSSNNGTKNTQEVTVNTPFSVDGIAEMTITKIDFTTDVLPSNPRSLYSHYKADPEKLYLVVNTTLKNLRKDKIKAEDLAKVTAIYSSGYRYTCFCIGDKNGDLDNFTYISPLTPERIKYIVQIPDNIPNDSEPLKIEIKINDKTFIYNYR